MPDPTTVSDAFLLTGDDDGEVEPIVDRVFARYDLDEMRYDHPEGFAAAALDRAGGVPSLAHDGYVVVSVPGGYVVSSPDGEACAGYLGCGLAVALGHRGLSLAAELCLRDYVSGGPGSWMTDVPCYSPGGMAAHLSVRRLARDPSVYATVLRDTWVEDGDPDLAAAVDAVATSADRTSRAAAHAVLERIVEGRRSVPALEGVSPPRRSRRGRRPDASGGRRCGRSRRVPP